MERAWGTEPVTRSRKVSRAIGTALTGLPIPGKMPKFSATLRVVDRSDAVVFESTGQTADIDSLELQILNDLIRLDVEAFRRSYGLAAEEEAP